MRCGLVPHWKKDHSIAIGTINAKSETGAIKAAFRDPLKLRRCWISAGVFYESKRTIASEYPAPGFAAKRAGPFAYHEGDANRPLRGLKFRR
jgi:putative SOS response-associated peptidase YedK